MAQVNLNSISKAYGAAVIIPGLDLEIHDGEFIALVGPSGSGKSTLLRLIAGLEDVTSGAIKVDGDDITNSDPSDRDMAMVFQSYALYPHMTVADNMGFALKMRKMDAGEIAERVASAVKMLDLTGMEDRKPSQLSGGQRQRVAMGRAIVRNPSLFLFDEPLSNLDAKLRTKTRLEIRELHDRLGATSVFVTHDQVEAMTMADRIVLLDHGVIKQVGPPQELYYHPKNKFVASFIGSPEMNFLSGKIAFSGDKVALVSGEATWDLPCSAAYCKQVQSKVSEGDLVDIGVRPEHFEFTKDNAKGSFEIVVKATEFTGQDLFIAADFSGKVVAMNVDSLKLGENKVPKNGSTLYVSPVADQWHLFDSETGSNLKLA